MTDPDDAPEVGEDTLPEDAEGDFRAGFVALIGQPNVGKSTLLNRLVGEAIAIATPKPQTTRNRILGIYNDPERQIAFLDTPGIHAGGGGLNRYMVDQALSTLSEVDVVLLLVDAARRLKGAREDRPEIAVDPVDQEIVGHLAGSGKPAILALNKVDAVPRALVLPLIEAYKDLHPWHAVYPLSAKTGENVAGLPAVLGELLPESPPMFPPDVFTDQAERFLAAEYVREAVIRHTRQEVPYATAVQVLLFDESEREGRKEGLVRIEANVVVERDSQKAIVIGKGGSMLKKIGADARKRLERLLGARVWLGLHVRVEKDWTRTPKGLRKLGYE